MNYSITIDHKHRLILYRHTGIIEKEEIGKAWEEILSKNEFTHQKYNLLSDYRNSRFNLEVADVDLICDFLYSITDKLKDKKQALIIDEPISTALSLLFCGEVNIKIGFKVEVFSTEKAALKWLEV